MFAASRQRKCDAQANRSTRPAHQPYKTVRKHGLCTKNRRSDPNSFSRDRQKSIKRGDAKKPSGEQAAIAPKGF